MYRCSRLSPSRNVAGDAGVSVITDLQSRQGFRICLRDAPRFATQDGGRFRKGQIQIAYEKTRTRIYLYAARLLRVVIVVIRFGVKGRHKVKSRSGRGRINYFHAFTRRKRYRVFISYRKIKPARRSKVNLIVKRYFGRIVGANGTRCPDKTRHKYKRRNDTRKHFQSFAFNFTHYFFSFIFFIYISTVIFRLFIPKPKDYLILFRKIGNSVAHDLTHLAFYGFRRK